MFSYVAAAHQKEKETNALALTEAKAEGASTKNTRNRFTTNGVGRNEIKTNISAGNVIESDLPHHTTLSTSSPQNSTRLSRSPVRAL